jgi:hypothetical protein
MRKTRQGTTETVITLIKSRCLMGLHCVQGTQG